MCSFSFSRPFLRWVYTSSRTLLRGFLWTYVQNSSPSLDCNVNTWNVLVGGVPALFVFGDSLVDAGNNIYVSGSPNNANYLPYGETYFHRPTGRFSNGKIIPDFLARYMGLPLLPPSQKPGANFSQGANFASAGSGILDTTNLEDHNLIPLSTQIQQFYKLGLTFPTIKLHNSIFLVITGSNDLLDGYLFNQTAQDAHTPQKYVELLIEEYSKHLLALYQGGARKIAIAGVGPLGCTPQLRLYAALLGDNVGCYEEMNKLALYFNEQLETLFRDLSSQLKDAKLVHIKPYEYVMDMIDNGSKYGFSVTDSNCCGSGKYNAMIFCGQKESSNANYKQFLCHKPSKYLFWDFHPTHQASRFISMAIWNGDKTIINPISLKQLANAT